MTLYRTSTLAIAALLGASMPGVSLAVTAPPRPRPRQWPRPTSVPSTRRSTNNGFTRADPRHATSQHDYARIVAAQDKRERRQRRDLEWKARGAFQQLATPRRQEP